MTWQAELRTLLEARMPPKAVLRACGIALRLVAGHRLDLRFGELVDDALAGLREGDVARVIQDAGPAIDELRRDLPRLLAAGDGARLAPLLRLRDEIESICAAVTARPTLAGRPREGELRLRESLQQLDASVREHEAGSFEASALADDVVMTELAIAEPASYWLLAAAPSVADEEDESALRALVHAANPEDLESLHPGDQLLATYAVGSPMADAARRWVERHLRDGADTLSLEAVERAQDEALGASGLQALRLPLDPAPELLAAAALRLPLSSPVREDLLSTPEAGALCEAAGDLAAARAGQVAVVVAVLAATRLPALAEPAPDPRTPEELRARPAAVLADGEVGIFVVPEDWAIVVRARPGSFDRIGSVDLEPPEAGTVSRRPEQGEWRIDLRGEHDVVTLAVAVNGRREIVPVAVIHPGR